jgi:hypothetical protein
MSTNVAPRIGRVKTIPTEQKRFVRSGDGIDLISGALYPNLK